MPGDGDEIRVELDRDADKPEKPKEGAVKYSEDEPNLVETFVKTEAGRNWLKKISRRVREDFDADFESTEQYRKRMADDFLVFAGDLPPKEFPYKDSANAHLPYMLENISRLQFRASSELFGDWKKPFGVVRVGTTPQEDEIVDILTVHGNWQIREQMPDFRRQIGERGVLLFFLTGDVTAHSYYDSFRQRNCHEILTANEFVAPYAYVTTQPDYSDLPHYTKVLRRYRHELQAQRGIWYGVDRVIKKKPPAWDDEPESPLRESIAEVQGIEAPDDAHHAPYKLLEYYGWLEMPPSDEDKAGDADETRDRFVQVIVDFNTRAVLKLCIYEEPSWQEKERFERQNMELEQYRMQQQQFEEQQAAVAQQLQQMQQGVQAGLLDPMAVQSMMIPLQQQQALAQPPPIPDWLQGEQVETAVVLPMRKEPIHMFTHGVCIEPILGNLGLGYGRIQADYNKAADTTLSQFMDAATMSNVWSLVTDSVAQFDKDFAISPGKINKVTGFTGKIDDHIKELRPSPANPQMFDFVRFMNEIAQSSIQAPNVLSGEPGKSGETYRGIATRIEQATRQLTVVTQKYAEFVRNVLKNNARLNAAFLPEEEMRYLMDYKLNTLQYVKVERRLYERNYDVVFESDLRYAPQEQRIAEADEVTQMALQTPVLQTNGAFTFEAIKKSLEARGRQDMVLELGMKPPAPPMFGFPTMPGMVPPGPGGPQGQQGGETPADGNGMQPPSPGVASGPSPQARPPGPGGPVATQPPPPQHPPR